MPTARVRPALLVAAAVLAAVAAGPPPALGQASPGDRRGITAPAVPAAIAAASQPTLTPADAAWMDTRLDLRADQRAAVTELLVAHAESFRAGLAEYRAAMRAARPPATPAGAAYRAEQESMRRRMQSLLASARAEAAAAPDDETARRIMAAAEGELDELRAMLAERLAELGPEAARDRPVADRLARMSEATAAWAARARALETATLEAIEVRLDDEQRPAWAATVQAVHRRTLPRGRLSGERSDLDVILRRAIGEPARRAAAAPALAAWADRLDAALTARDGAAPALEATIARLEFEAFDDPAVARRLESPVRRLAALHQAVRDVNVSGAASILEALAPEDRLRFETAWRRDAFPAIAGPSDLDRLLDGAVVAPELSPEDRTVIAALRDDWRAERRGLDAAIIAATLGSEVRAMVDASLVAESGRVPADPAGESAAWRARRARAAAIAEAVRSLVGEAAFARLPGARVFRR